jgi:hypothetical protein
MDVIKCVLNVALEMKGNENWNFVHEDHISLPCELRVT